MTENSQVADTVTISVGNAGVYNSDGSKDMSAIINSELAAVPKGEHIDLVFAPGLYALASTILLPSNTDVVGNGATLTALNGAGFNGSSYLSNADAYHINNSLYDSNNDGTVTHIPYNAGSTLTMTTNSSKAIVDSNIIVSGLVFNESGNSLDTNTYSNVDTRGNVFGSWFTNARNICVQNNVYIGGCDGNAFVNVANGVVANNIAIGQMAAYDNWDGPVNITIEDNQAWQYSINDQQVASAAQINSTPSGDPTNPGTAFNDGIIENLMSGDTPRLLSAAATWPLPGYGPTLVPTYDVTQQGNIDSLLNTPDAQGYYMDYTQGSVTEDNIISQAVLTSLVTSSIIQDINWGASATSHGDLRGNLIVGEYSSTTGSPFIASQGIGSDVVNNAILAESSFDPHGFSGTSLGGNISNVGTTVLGEALPQTFSILAEPDIIMTGSSTIDLSGGLAPQIVDISGSTFETVSLITQFGSLILPSTTSSYSENTRGGETTLILTGSLDAVDATLSHLVYVPSVSSISDSIEIVASDSKGNSATRYVPIISTAAISGSSEVVTIGSGFLTTLLQSSTVYSELALPTHSTLSGEVLIAEGTNNVLTMGNTVSAAFLGAGQSTVLGGSNQEYISTGSGNDVLNLTGSGRITVAGGPGALLINANSTYSTANDLIQTGNSNATVNGGASEISVIGGLGNLTYNGGSGGTYLATLPQDGGKVEANLGSGNSTVFALSGDVTLSTDVGTRNYIYLGMDSTTLHSSGTDNIELGAGYVTVDARAGAYDVLQGGTGLITYIDETALNGTLPGVLVNGGTTITGAFNGVNLLATQSGDIIAAQQDASIEGGNHNDTIFGGLGNLTFSQAGTSVDTLVEDQHGNSSISFSAGSDTFIGGTGIANIVINQATSEDVTVGEGGGTIIALNCGSLNLKTTYGAKSTISLSNSLSNNVLISSHGIDQISGEGAFVLNSYAGSSDTILVNDSATVNTFGGSYDSIVSTGNLLLEVGLNSKINPAAVAIPAPAAANVDIKGGSATVTAWNLSSTDVNVENASLRFINTSILPQTVTGGAGASITIAGGVGGGFYTGGASGNNELIGGDGVVTLIGGGNGDYLQANSWLGTNLLESGIGMETLCASTATGDNKFIINAGSEAYVESQGSGMQTFMLQAGPKDSVTLTGSAAINSHNIFDLAIGQQPGGTHYYVRNFNRNNSEFDITSFVGNGAVDISAVSIDAAPGINGAILALTDGTSIMLSNCTPSQLQVIQGANGSIRVL